MLSRSLRVVSAMNRAKVVSSIIKSNGSKLLQTSHNRSFSTMDEKSKSSSLSKKLLDEDDYDDYEEAKTSGQKLRWLGVLFVRLGFITVGLYCVYLTGVELFPGRMSPNHLYNSAFELVRYDEDILRVAGDGMKAYGKEVGGSSKGRRNHVEQYRYISERGDQRTRVKFNVEGSKGVVRVWAEVSEDFDAGKLVYLICQDVKTRRVYTLIDNREELDGKPLANTLGSWIHSFNFSK
jgi:hypothetical protein